MRQKRKPFSKKIIASVMIVGVLFIIFCCYEMHRLGDLSPLAYIGTSIIGLMATAVGFYVKRAYKEDQYNLALRKIEAEEKLGRKIDMSEVSDGFDMNV